MTNFYHWNLIRICAILELVWNSPIVLQVQAYPCLWDVNIEYLKEIGLLQGNRSKAQYSTHFIYTRFSMINNEFASGYHFKSSSQLNDAWNYGCNAKCLDDILPIITFYSIHLATQYNYTLNSCNFSASCDSHNATYHRLNGFLSWKHSPHNRPFVKGNHRSMAYSPHKGSKTRSRIVDDLQRHGVHVTLLLTLIHDH